MRARSFLLMLLVPGTLLLFADLAWSENREHVREVRFYEPRFYDGADLPFAISPPETLTEDQVTAEWVRQAVLKRKAVVEVCTLIQNSVTRMWRSPKGLQERKRYCFAYR